MFFGILATSFLLETLWRSLTVKLVFWNRFVCLIIDYFFHVVASESYRKYRLHHEKYRAVLLKVQDISDLVIVLNYELVSSYVVKTTVYQGYFHIFVVLSPLRSHRIAYVVIKM
jgi:hypothetical protein